MEKTSLYLHIPFCKHRCGYCDFNTYAGLDDLIPHYINALCKELVHVAQGAEKPIHLHTIFFGGGTPSLVPANLLSQVISMIHENFMVDEDAEITMELNPGTVELDYFQEIKKFGVNRLSMGVQSASPKDLQILERQHGYGDAVVAVEQARQAGFENISLDLIFGVPFQTMEDWKRNVTLALDLEPQHLSLYALTVEHGTPLEKSVLSGSLPAPDPDLAADMYEWAEEKLENHGFFHYEISNWAREDRAGSLLVSRHNLQYWLYHPYIGVGAGAHGFIAQHRTVNVLSPKSYIERLESDGPKKFPRTPATVSAKRIDREEEIKETMMMGLRLLQHGVSRIQFSARFGQSLHEVYKNEIEDLVGKGLLEWGGENKENLVLSQKGRLLGNRVFMQFV